MVAVQHIVLAPPQFDTQAANEFDFPPERNRRMDHVRTERACFLFHFSRLVKRAVESPVDTNIPFPGVPQHTHEPVFYRSTIEIFDYVEYSFGQRLCCESAASVQVGSSRTGLRAGDLIF